MTTNPQHLHILRHALGLGRSKREYRNRYCPGGDDIAACEQLEAAGLMSSYETDWIPGRVYVVTEAGKAVARGDAK